MARRTWTLIGVVEDDDIDYDALRRVVDPGVRLVRWRTGEELLAAIDSGEQLEAFSLLLVDFYLPGIDGAQTVEQVRSRRGGPTATIVMLSGEGSRSVAAARAANARIDRFEIKPASIVQLRTLVTRALALASARRAV